jgi:quercetin dioxygenase-like cupin family protein
MKRFLALTTAMAMLATTNSFAANLTVNGKEVNTDVEIVNDTSMLPVRNMLEALNYNVGWDGETKTVTAESDIMLENEGALENAKPIYGLGDKFETDKFTGDVYLKALADNGGVSIANVTFDKGCINDWHVHDHVQVLMGTMGEGYVQMEGEDAQLIKAGDVVVIPAGTKHWHGATHNSQFTHISVSGPVVDYNTEWLEPVSQEEYDKLD